MVNNKKSQSRFVVSLEGPVLISLIISIYWGHFKLLQQKEFELETFPLLTKPITPYKMEILDKTKTSYPRFLVPSLDHVFFIWFLNGIFLVLAVFGLFRDRLIIQILRFFETHEATLTYENKREKTKAYIFWVLGYINTNPKSWPKQFF